MRQSEFLILLVTALTVQQDAARAQVVDVAALLGRSSVRAALSAARTGEPTTIDDQIRFCEIPAPPFKEELRARAYAAAFRSAGLTNVRIDREGNVLAERPGRAARPHLVFSAHLDTVFPEGTDVRVRRDGAVLRGPGIGDDCRGLAVLVAVARALDAGSVETAGSITFVGTVGEEGLGDLRGTKALFDETLKGRVDRFVSVEGAGDSIFTVGVGSRRFRVTFTGPGGHSYDDFGIANPVHAMGRAVALLAELQVADRPRATFSIGRVGGGTSVNAIASDAWMEVDLRSSDAVTLQALDDAFRQSVARAVAEENRRWNDKGRVSVQIDIVGERPAGSTGRNTSIVHTAIAVARALSLPARIVEGSTDANVPMALGIPALAVGSGGRGARSHTLQETFDTTNSWHGTQRAVLLAIALAEP